MTQIDAKRLAERLNQAKSIEELIGRDGILTDVFKDTIQAMMEAEATEHLGYPKGNRIMKQTRNKRNGSYSRGLRSSFGETEIEVPRDRDGTFEAQILKKYQTNTSELEDKIISMYAKGMTLSDMNTHLTDLYGIHVTDSLLSNITDKVWPLVEEWQSRPLNKVYPIVFLDAVHYKVRNEGKIVSKAVYLIIGLDMEGRKDVLGMWIGSDNAESAKFWLKVLTEIKNRGVEDILILCCDNLSGVSEAIKAAYPETIIQKCIVHQIRNTLKYLASKDQRTFLQDLKTVYRAKTRDEAETNLDKLEKKWETKYPIVLKSWRNNWPELSHYLDYDESIRKLIYTTNPIEAYNRQLRKVTKTRAVFPTDMALLKLLWLANNDITKKWTMPRQGWAQTIAQLDIHFPNRIPLTM
jgi:transposase-like protein